MVEFLKLFSITLSLLTVPSVLFGGFILFTAWVTDKLNLLVATLLAIPAGALVISCMAFFGKWVVGN